VATVHSTDGSTHTERALLAERPTLYAAEISGFSSAFACSRRARPSAGGWSPGGTRLERTFAFELRSPLHWPLGAALGSLFRKALRRNHENFLRHLERQEGAATGSEAGDP